LKENITLINDSLDKLRQINVYNFNWNNDLSAAKLPQPRMWAGKRDTGFIAQELSAAWPYAIDNSEGQLFNNDKTMYAQVNYTKVLPLVMSAIKEMNTIIEQLSAK
jgi:hypothetical protein